MKYTGKIEAKEEKKTKANMQYFCFTIDGKKWNCFDPITKKDFVVDDYVEFETEKKGEYENLIPETMKKISEKKQEESQAPVLINPQGTASIVKHINENPDSLEIGTPSKGGAIKIYGNFDEPEAFIVKFTNAKKVRDEANKLLMTE